MSVRSLPRYRLLACVAFCLLCLGVFGSVANMGTHPAFAANVTANAAVPPKAPAQFFAQATHVPAKVGAVSSAAAAATLASKPSAKSAVAVIPGRVHCRMDSRVRHERVSYDAFLPVDAKAGERFPALYLLHGAYDDGTAWAREMGDILPRLATQYRLVLIAPSGGRKGWYVDSPLVAKNQMESFVIKELIPHAEANLPLSRQRGILGMSMGGHGAFVLALRHPGGFASVSSMSGVLDITLHPQQWGIKDVLGPLDSRRALWESYSAVRLLASLPAGTPLPALLVTTGSEDHYVLVDNRAMRDVLRRRDELFTYRETAGVHDWTYWCGELPRHVAFHAAVMTP